MRRSVPSQQTLLAASQPASCSQPTATSSGSQPRYPAHSLRHAAASSTSRPPADPSVLAAQLHAASPHLKQRPLPPQPLLLPGELPAMSRQSAASVSRPTRSATSATAATSAARTLVASTDSRSQASTRSRPSTSAASSSSSCPTLPPHSTQSQSSHSQLLPRPSKRTAFGDVSNVCLVERSLNSSNSMQDAPDAKRSRKSTIPASTSTSKTARAQSEAERPEQPQQHSQIHARTSQTSAMTVLAAKQALKQREKTAAAAVLRTRATTAAGATSLASRRGSLLPQPSHSSSSATTAAVATRLPASASHANYTGYTGHASHADTTLNTSMRSSTNSRAGSTATSSTLQRSDKYAHVQSRVNSWASSSVSSATNLSLTTLCNTSDVGSTTMSIILSDDKSVSTSLSRSRTLPQSRPHQHVLPASGSVDSHTFQPPQSRSQSQSRAHLSPQFEPSVSQRQEASLAVESFVSSQTTVCATLGDEDINMDDAGSALSVSDLTSIAVQKRPQPTMAVKETRVRQHPPTSVARDRADRCPSVSQPTTRVPASLPLAIKKTAAKTTAETAKKNKTLVTPAATQSSKAMALQTRTPAARLTSKSTILKDLGQQLGVRDLEQLARHMAAASWTRIPKSVSAPASLLAADYFDSLAGPVPQASRRVSRTSTATQWWYAPAERDPDILLVTEYADDIYAHLRYMETRTRPPVADYMAALQPHLSWGMRQQLLCWLIQVHNRFRLVPETLFLAVNVVDRFLGLKAGVALDKLQLVGVTALLLAAKFEETLVPPVSDLVYMVDGAYTADEILHAERFMLRVLAFEMGAPGPYGFVRRISAADRYDGSVRNVAKFFLEVGMLDSRLVAVVSSHLAAAAMFLAAKVAYEAPWTAAHEQASGYTEQQLLPCVYMLLEDVSGLCRLVQQQTQHKTQSVQAGTGTGTTGGSGGCADGGSDSDGLVVVYDKYAGDKYGRVSLHVHDFLRRMSLV